MSSDPSGPTELAVQTSGDLALRAWSDGSFALTAAGRTVLAGPAAPLGARSFHETVRSLFGQWTFARTDVAEARPTGTTTATRDGDAMVLRSTGAAGTSTLRFRRVADGDVEVRARVEGAGAFQATVMHFRCDAAARFLGFGEQYNATEHRGRAFPLWPSEQGIGRDPHHPSPFSGNHDTTYFPVPFFLDPRGFGLAVDTDARTEVDLCATNTAEYTLAPEQPEEVVLHLYTGPTVADVMRAWTVLQGRSSAPPAWAVDGVWLGVQGGPAAVRSAVQAARAANVPLAAIWAQDWVGTRDFGVGNVGVRYRWSVDAAQYPDLAGLITELRSGGVRFLGYMNPFLVPEQDLYAPAVAGGFVVTHGDGSPYTFPISVLSGGLVDLTNPAARSWYQGYADAALALGLSGWMQDFGEWLPYDARLSDGSDARRQHARYPQAWHAAARTAMERAHPDGDFVLLTRSGWLREAQTAQVVWAGDQEATWSADDGLPTVIPALVSLGLAGIGYVTEDVAGFSGGPSTKELFLRWVELAAFTPVLRTHEGLQRAQNWAWNRDAETTVHFSRFARVHAALAPRIRALGDEHRATGMPIVRSLPLVFPSDAATYAITDEFMLGDDLLVAPVVTQGATTRAVYLPAGRWFDVWSPDRAFEGGRTVTVDAPIGRPPVFSRTARTDLAAIR